LSKNRIGSKNWRESSAKRSIKLEPTRQERQNIFDFLEEAAMTKTMTLTIMAITVLAVTAFARERRAASPSEYVYFPDFEIYYSNVKGVYYFQLGDRWTSSLFPPETIRTDVLWGSVRVTVSLRTLPEKSHERISKKYPHGWRPPGWDRGKKTGWTGDTPPGLEKKSSPAGKRKKENKPLAPSATD
jgi:hypothetical protein